MKSLEQQLVEKDQEIRELKRAGKGAGATHLELALANSALPEVAKGRLRKKLPATAPPATIREAIRAESEYVRRLRAPGQAAELVEAYKMFGFNAEEARLAAGIVEAVEGIAEGRERLAAAGKLLGLSDKEIREFVKI